MKKKVDISSMLEKEEKVNQKEKIAEQKVVEQKVVEKPKVVEKVVSKLPPKPEKKDSNAKLLKENISGEAKGKFITIINIYLIIYYLTAYAPESPVKELKDNKIPIPKDINKPRKSMIKSETMNSNAEENPEIKKEVNRNRVNSKFNGLLKGTQQDEFGNIQSDNKKLIGDKSINHL
jgi:hypothetical protein